MRFSFLASLLTSTPRPGFQAENVIDLRQARGTVRSCGVEDGGFPVASDFAGGSMAKGGETFRKRQREVKLREKAQLKRELRAQRRNDKKAALTSEPSATSEFSAVPPEIAVPEQTDPESPG